MKFEIAFTRTAAGHVRSYRKFDQRIILDAIDEQLTHEPTTETRNRKRLSESELSDWELRVQDFRVFYDVVVEDERPGRQDQGRGSQGTWRLTHRRQRGSAMTVIELAETHPTLEEVIGLAKDRGCGIAQARRFGVCPVATGRFRGRGGAAQEQSRFPELPETALPRRRVDLDGRAAERARLCLRFDSRASVAPSSALRAPSPRGEKERR